MNIYLDKKNDLTEKIFSYIESLTDAPYRTQDDCFVFKLMEMIELPHSVSVRFYETSNKTEYKDIFGETKELNYLSDIQVCLIEDLKRMIQMKKDDIEKIERLLNKIIFD